MRNWFTQTPTTIGIAVATTLCSLLYVWVLPLRPYLGFGELEQGPTVLAVVFNGLVCLGHSPLNVVLLALLFAFFNQGLVRRLWLNNRVQLVAGIITVFFLTHLLQRLLFRGLGWGFVSALLVLFWLGSALESRWGSRRLLFFSILVGYFAQIVGLIWFSIVGGTDSALGAHPLLNGWMTALCCMYGRQKVGGLGVTSYQLIWVLVAIDGFPFLMDGSLLGLMGLMGTLSAWLLVTGRVRPEQFLRIKPSRRSPPNLRIIK